MFVVLVAVCAAGRDTVAAAAAVHFADARVIQVVAWRYSGKSRAGARINHEEISVFADWIDYFLGRTSMFVGFQAFTLSGSYKS